MASRLTLRRAVAATLLAGITLLVVRTVEAAPGADTTGTATVGAAASADDACAGSHWVGAWQAAPQSSSLGRPDDAAMGLADGVARVFENQTVRTHVVPHVGGAAVRVHLGNRFGHAPLSIGAATVRAGDLHPLTFAGATSVDVPAGGSAVSDPVSIAVEPFQTLVVSIHVTVPATPDYHQWAQATHLATPVGSGDHTGDVSDAAFTEQLTGVYGVTAIDVLAPATVGAVVTLGDSITDGVGSTPDADQRWPDHLARRLVDPAGGRPISVVNAGIGGNHVVTDAARSAFAVGPSARDRFAHDVLGVAGVTDVFLFEGINDIFMSDEAIDVAPLVIEGYRSIIEQARAAGLRVTGATITPASMSGPKEAARLRINEWIRTSGAYDAVVDFDAVVRDPSMPSRLLPAIDAGFAHMTDAGYRLLAEAVDLTLFRGSPCA